jgi:hypothetical protein
LETTGKDRAGVAGWLLPAMSAAAVAVVVVVGAGLSQLDLDKDGSRGQEPPFGPDEIQETTRATNGQVADVFTCPRPVPYDFGGGGSALEGAAFEGPRAFADEMGATRFELVGGPEATVLRLGNEDGSLASLNTMHRERHGWVLDDMTACDGGESMLVPTPNHGRLGVHGAEPWPAEGVVGDPADAVLVDDREYYNPAGLVMHRSIFAFPCGDQVCLTATDGDSLRSETVAADGAPEDLTEFFLPDESLQDRPPPYSFLAVYDAEDELPRVTWDPGRGGQQQPVEPVDAGPWTGRLFLLLAAHDPDGLITTHARDGAVRTFDARGHAVP